MRTGSSSFRQRVQIHNRYWVSAYDSRDSYAEFLLGAEYDGSMKNDFRTRALTAVVLVAVVVPCLILGGQWLRVLLILVGLFGAWEISGLALNEGKRAALTVILWTSMAGLTFCAEESLASALGLWFLILASLCLVKDFLKIDQACTAFGIGTLMVLSARAVQSIYATTDGWKLMIYIVAVCTIADTGAYLFGSCLGKHPMVPAISPRKTWEGAVGGYVCSAVLSYIYGLLVCEAIGGWQLAVCSLILPAAAEIGDLIFSMIKRH